MKSVKRLDHQFFEVALLDSKIIEYDISNPRIGACYAKRLYFIYHRVRGAGY